MRRALLLTALATLVGCGATVGGPAGDDDASNPDGSVASDGNPSFPDGELPPDDGGVEDANPPCFYVTIQPPTEAAATRVKAHAAGGAGAPAWHVTGPLGETVAHQIVDNDPYSISFFAGVHGTYTVTTGQDCVPATVDLLPSTAEQVLFALRFAPRAHAAPIQSDRSDFFLKTGLDQLDVGPRWLRSGRAIDLTIAGEIGLLGAQVSFAPKPGPLVEGGLPVTLFADPTSRSVHGQIVSELMQDVLIVPIDGQLAPFTLSPFTDELHDTLAFESGAPFDGLVLDASGNPVVGATVSAGAEGKTPALTTTNATGHFHLDVRHGNLRIDVIPPHLSGLPSFLLPPDAGIRADGGDVVIGLAPAAQVQLSGWQVKRVDSTPIHGAHVTFIAAAVGPGKISQGGAFVPVPASETRVRVEVDGNGDLEPGVSLPAASYQVVVEPLAPSLTDVASMTAVDLSAASGSVTRVLSTAAPGQFGVQVFDFDGTTAIGRAHVTAVAQGLLGVGKGAASPDDADDAGRVVAVSGPPAMVYDVIVDAPRGGTLHARGRKRIDAAHATAVEEVRLPPTTIVTGTVTRDGHSDMPVADVIVSAYCKDAGCPDPDFAWAETTTDASGKFTLALPDLARAP